MENDGKGTIFAWDVEHFKAKKFRQLPEEEKQAGIQGQRQQESPAREYLEQVKCCHDTDCNESMMKKGVQRDLQGKYESLRMGLRQGKRGVRLGCKKDEVEKMNIVQEIMLNSADSLRRIIAPVGGQGGVTMSYLCPNCNGFLLEDYVCGSLPEKPQSGGAQMVEKSMTGGNRTGFWSCIQEKDLSRRRSSKRIRYRRACEKI